MFICISSHIIINKYINTIESLKTNCYKQLFKILNINFYIKSQHARIFIKS